MALATALRNSASRRRSSGSELQSAISMRCDSPSPDFAGRRSSSDNSVLGAKTLFLLFMKHSFRAMRKTHVFNRAGSRS